MKLLLVFAIIFLKSAQGSWLSDVYTGLNEAVEDSKIKEKIQILGTNIKNVKDETMKKIKEEIPNNDWVSVTKDFLHNIQFKEVLKEKADEKMEDLVDQWNGILRKLSTINEEESGKEMYKSIKKDLQKLLSPKLFKQWKAKIHSIAKSLKDAMSKKIKDFDVGKLKKNIKKWMQPAFMQNEDELEEQKKMVKDAVEAVNENLKKEADKVGKKVIPVIKMTKEKKITDKAEKKLEKWLQKKFTKPHHVSGHSKWKLLLEKLPLDKMKKVFEHKDVTFKKMKKQLKKLANLNKKLVVIKDPVKTVSKMINSNGEVFISKDDRKKMESLTPEEQKEYEEAEAKWEKKMLEAAMKLNKKLIGHGDEKPTPTPMMTGNENWKLIDNDFEDDDNDFDNYDDTTIQKTKPKLNKEFLKKLAEEEQEWYGLRKKMKTML
jgi:hypothetical protein